MIKPYEEKGSKEEEIREAFRKYMVHSYFWGYFAEKQELEKKQPSLEIVKEAAPLFKKLGVKTILDIGCGNGRDAIYLGTQGFTVDGIDSSQKAIAFFQERVEKEGIRNVHPILGDATDIRHPDGSFDAVTIRRVLDVCRKRDAKQIVDETERVLKHHGIAYVSMASVRSEIYQTSFYGLGLVGFDEPGTLAYKDFILHFFSEDEIRKLFKNFNVISLQEELASDNKNNFWILFAEKKK